MLKPTPSLPPPLEAIELLIPMTSPFMLTSGPPEFPGLIAASVWRKSWFSTSCSSSMCRPRALMIPWLTEWVRPKGLPRARTQVPTAASSLLPSRAAGRSSRPSSSTAMSASASDQTRSGCRARPVLQVDVDLARRGPEDHVVIRQDVQALPPVGPDDDPRAGLLELADAVALLVPARLAGDDVDHRGRDGSATSSKVRSICWNCSYCRASADSSPPRSGPGPPCPATRRRGRPRDRRAGGLVTCAATNGPPRSKATPRKIPKVKVASSTSGVRVRAISTGLRSEARDERRRDRLRGLMRADGGPVRVWTSINIRSATPPSQRTARFDLPTSAVIRRTVRIGGPSRVRCGGLRQARRKKKPPDVPAVSRDDREGRWRLIGPIRSGPSRNRSG